MNASDQPDVDRPAFFQSSWQAAWHGLGAQGNGAALREQLLARYAEPQRHYHSLQHLGECLALFAEVRGQAQQPHEVALALWFHDAVYDVPGQANEQQSADWARSALLQAAVPPDAAGRVHALVMATRHTAVPVLADERLLVDIDLSILGASPDRFAEYERQIRQEYAFVPADVFREKRKAVLGSFLARPFIYGTAHFQADLEFRARSNLRCAIGLL